MERVPLQQKVLSENDRIAAELRAKFQDHGIFCMNLISSPGSGQNQPVGTDAGEFPAA